jgi:1-acyl-sn-glycerol-3-phosphate acyltransferase
MLRALFSVIIWPIATLMFLLAATLYITVSLFFPPRELHRLASFLCRFVLLCAGQWLSVKGSVPDPKNGPHLYLFNHVSLFDQFILIAAIREFVTGVGALKQFSWPVWGLIVRRYGIIPIQRRNLKKAIHSIDLAEEEVRKGVSLMIAPEGTRTLTGKLGPFKKGPFHLALHTNITIIPVAFINAFRAKNKNDWRIRPGRLIAYFGEPIKNIEYKGQSVEELQQNVRERIIGLKQVFILKNGKNKKDNV